MKKFDYPLEPVLPFEGAHPAYGYGGHAARCWGNYSTLTIHEITALSFGMNPLTSDSFWENRDNYGTMHLSMWNDRITEVVRAVYAGEIRAVGDCTKITENTLVFASDAEKYFKQYELDDAREKDVLGNKVKSEASKDKNLIKEIERKTLLKIILGMAMHGYGFKPNSKKNPATGTKKGSIYAALQFAALDVDDDTIRKYLNEAVEVLLDIKPLKI